MTAIWLNPWYDNVNHLNAAGDLRRAGRSPTTTATAPSTSTRSRSTSATSRTLRELVDAAHALGIKVIQDQVANHTGPYHPWVAGLAHADLVQRHAGASPREHLADLDARGPALAARACGRRRSTGWFIDILPDLNQDDPEVARYIIQNTLWWVGVTGLDGIRQDTLPYVPRRFWRDWMAAIKREYPRPPGGGRALRRRPRARLLLPGRPTPASTGSTPGIDTLFDFPLYFTIRDAPSPRGRPLREVAQMLAPRPPLPRPVGARHVPRPARRAALHERAGRDAPTGLKLAFTFLLTAAGHTARLLRRRDRDAGRRRPGQPARLPGRLPGRPAERLRGRGPHARGGGGARARARAAASCGRRRRRCGAAGS